MEVQVSISVGSISASELAARICERVTGITLVDKGQCYRCLNKQKNSRAILPISKACTDCRKILRKE